MAFPIGFAERMNVKKKEIVEKFFRFQLVVSSIYLFVLDRLKTFILYLQPYSDQRVLKGNE